MIEAKSKVDVVVTNYNGEHLLGPCLDSLHRQDLKPGKVIVVDDASTDDSVSFIHSYYPNVQILEQKVNRGYCAAINRGIQASESKYVAALNNDAQAGSRWLQALVETMEENSTIGSGASKMLFLERPDHINSAGIEMRVDGKASDIGYGQQDNQVFNESRRIFGACGGAAIFRRDALTDVGLFDEDFEAFSEDVDWAFRAQLKDWDCLYVPDAVVYHKAHASYGPRDYHKIFLTSRNIIYVLMKDMPGNWLRQYAPQITALQIYNLMYCAKIGQLRAAVNGKLQAIRDKDRTFEKRRRIMAGRLASDQKLEEIVDHNITYNLTLLRKLLSKGPKRILK